mgnify:CR=1 FL=1
MLDLNEFIKVKKRIIGREILIKSNKVMDKVRLHREMLKRTWFSFPIDENKVDSHEIQVNLSVGRVKTIQDTRKFYSSQTYFYGNLALFYALKYKLYNRNYKLVVKL